MNQYAAKLLFQWRPVRQGSSRRRRVCEERIIRVTAGSAEAALQKAKNTGESAAFEHPAYGRSEGHVFFEFVGVCALKRMDTTEDGEVWYELFEMVDPMERREQLIPSDEELIAHGQRADERRKLSAW